MMFVYNLLNLSRIKVAYTLIRGISYLCIIYNFIEIYVKM